MKILLTGAASFTGYWIAEALSEAGHEVIAPLRGGMSGGADPMRAERIRRLSGRPRLELVPDCPFGSERFQRLVGATGFDMLCHHAAEVTDYRNPDFDIGAALAANTASLREVLRHMRGHGARHVLLTGSIFEPGEGAGSEGLRGFSAYGVSKALTAEVFRFRCEEAGLTLRKFIIPAPFGPLEQPRLGAYLAKTWKSGGVAEIKTPAYVRDNIHVGLLAKAYARFAAEDGGAPKLQPSGYVESQGAFVERVAREVQRRTGLECRVTLAVQTSFPEPVIRVNTDPADRYVGTWDEAAAWDAYAAAMLGNG